jgi:hypothetical protein
METGMLLLTDTEGRKVSASLWQSLTDKRVWHAELQFEHEGQWLYLDLISLGELEGDGAIRWSDGSLSLCHVEPADNEDGIVCGPSMTLPSTEVERLLEWAREQLRVKPQNRLRPSALAERVLVGQP